MAGPVNRLPILTYHSLDDSGSPISVGPALFWRQMEWLRNGSWSTLGTDALLDGHGRGHWPERTCVLTFDDGFANFAEHALPVLREFGFTAHVFVVAGWVGRTNSWPGQPAWAPRLPLMSWNALREIAAAGTLLGAHTLNHPHPACTILSDIEHEIVESKRLIEDQTGQAVETFAYPYGEATPAAEAVVARAYRAGFGTELGFATPASRLTCFERLDNFYVRHARIFKALDKVWVRRYLSVRRYLRHHRFGT